MRRELRYAIKWDAEKRQDLLFKAGPLNMIEYYFFLSSNPGCRLLHS